MANNRICSTYDFLYYYFEFFDSMILLVVSMELFPLELTVKIIAFK